MWHIAPILCAISSKVGWGVGIAEDETKNISGIYDSLKVVDLGFVGRIPRAVEDWAALG